ncbi:MAG: peptidylprolyl isomerase [Myxococcota bacterium]
MTIEVEHTGDRGTIDIELMPELAPKSVEHVVKLARSGYFDGTTFHRVIPGFMIQGGDPNSRDADPTNDGRGGDPTPIPDEFGVAPFERGVVALANRGQRNSSTPQLFIMQSENRDLDGRYNVIGRVRTGLDRVDAIAQSATDQVGRWGPKDRPLENVVLRRVTVATGAPTDASSEDPSKTPAADAPGPARPREPSREG